MAQRKPWAQLSPTYRARLESKGITAKEFESGASIQAARGHASTPERPTQYDPAKYKNYDAERKKLTNAVMQKKQEFFGGKGRWDSEKADRAIRSRPPSMAQLRWAAHKDRTEGDYLDEIREDPSGWRFLGYH